MLGFGSLLNYSTLRFCCNNRISISGLVPSDGCGADLSFAQCYGNSQWDPFFGGGFNMNDHTSILGNSGWQTIANAEYDHDERYFPENGPFRFKSAFVGMPWPGFFGDPQKPAQEKPKQDYQALYDKVKNDCLGREKAKADAARNQYVARWPKRVSRAGVFGATRGAAMGVYAGANAR